MSNLPYISFEPLMAQLARQGFRVGPDVHIKVQRLLQKYAEKKGLQDTDRLRFQLGALIAHSEKELKLFYTIFDTYVAGYAGSWFPAEPTVGAQSDLQIEDDPSINGWYSLALLPLLVLAVMVFLPPPCPEQAPAITISLPHPDHGQTIAFSDAARYTYPWWSLKRNPRGDSLIWDFGDGDTAHAIAPTHHYQKPGKYDVAVQAFLSNGCEKRQKWTITVEPTLRLRAQFTYTETDSGYRFVENSYVYRGEPLQPTDTPLVMQYRWQLGTADSRTEREFTWEEDVTDTVEITLFVKGTWKDTTVSDTFGKTIYPFHPPVFPSLRNYLQDVSLEELIAPPIRNPWSFWLMVGLVLGYIVYELIKGWQRRRIAAQMALRSPPLHHPLDLASPPLDFFHSQDFYRLARQLRRRRIGGSRPTPDVPRSVQKTIQAGGFPTLAFKTRSQASQYLVLIEQKSPDDHLAKLFAEVAQELSSRDIAVSVFFYDKDPRLCWRKHRQDRTPLTHLRNIYPDYRLLVIGEGEGLLDAEGTDLASWTIALDGWQEKAWLSTKPTAAWGSTEQALSQQFVVVPATQQGLDGLIQQWMAEAPLSPKEWKKIAYADTFYEDADDPISEVRAYLGKRQFQWLAACALYPELNWGLTLRLGKQVQPLISTLKAPLLTLDKLVQLFRIPWFRYGEIPEDIRTQLVQVLERDVRAEAEALIHAILREPQNQPPPDAYAATDHEVRLALLTYHQSLQGAADRRQLRASIRRLDPDELEDRVSLSALRKVPSQLTAIIPPQFFRGNIPLLGVQPRWRWLMVGLPLMIMLGMTAWWNQQAKRERPYDPFRSYAASELLLESAADSALWLTHEGYLMGTDTGDVLATGEALFAQAYALDSTADTTVHNLLLSQYETARWQYAADSLAAAQNHLRAQQHVAQSIPYIRGKQAGWVMTLLGTTELLRVGREASDNQAIETLIKDGAENLALGLCGKIETGDSLLPPPLSMMLDRDFEALLRTRHAAFPEDMLPLMLCTNLITPEEDTIENSIPVPDKAPQDLRIFLGGRIRIIPNGQNNPEPAHASVTLLDEKTRTDKLGEFSLSIQLSPKLRNALADVRISVEIPMEKRRLDTTVSVRLSPQMEPIDVVLDLRETPKEARALLAGTIMAGKGEPVKEAAVSVQYAIRKDDSEMPTGYVSPRIVTNVRGQFTYEVPPNVEAEIGIHADGYEQLDTVIRAGASGTTTRFTLYLQRKQVSYDPQPIIDRVQGNMVRLAGGNFKMGEGRSSGSNGPEHDVTVSTFYMGRYEVTNAEFAAFLNVKGLQPGWYTPTGAGGIQAAITQQGNDLWTVRPGLENEPVTFVMWAGAKAFCDWLSEETGYTYRLPTEAEWEYAASEGAPKAEYKYGKGKAPDIIYVDGTKYAGSNRIEDVAWYQKNSRGLYNVGQKAPNEFGMYDMSGNVWEWCQDWYGNYNTAKSANPIGPTKGSLRVIRGGSIREPARNCEVKHRNSQPPRLTASDVGFRIVRNQ